MSPTEEGNEAKFMDENVNLKNVIQCLVDGNLHEKLCRVCLSPLDEFCENIFTRVCKEGKEYCIADVLEKVCGLTVPSSENFCICSNCFICASSAYKFFLMTKRSEEIVNFYLKELDKNFSFLEGPIIAEIEGSICISVPIIDKCEDTFDYNLEAFALERDLVNDRSSCGSETSQDQEMPEEADICVKVEIPTCRNDLIIPDKLPAKTVTVCVNPITPKTVSAVKQPTLKTVSAVKQPTPKTVNAVKLPTTKTLSAVKHATHKTVRADKQPTSNKSNEVYQPASEMKIKQEIIDEDEDNVIIVLDESGKANYFRVNATGALVKVTKEEMKSYDVVFSNSVGRKDFPEAVVKKERKKREKMAYRKCSRCEVEYRFVSKLVEHMKTDHHVDLQICKICKFTTEDVTTYREHLGEHSNCYICAVCGKSFKKRNTLVAHLASHEDTVSSAGAHICEICGLKLASEETLKDHHESKHNNKFTCFYCGRSYKGQISFESHVKKHENNMGLNGEVQACNLCPKSFPSLDKLELHIELEHDNVKPYQCQVCGVKLKSRDMLNSHVNTHSNRDFFCETCGRGFVDARALLWHRRLHTDERPFKCKTCGKGFVSNNRRNSHAVCAHTAPTRRCPLCPALFHLRSMVNSHIKKVHLKAHKRRNRSNKYPDVYWRTETVPIGELSVALQSDILDHIADNTDYTATCWWVYTSVSYRTLSLRHKRRNRSNNILLRANRALQNKDIIIYL